MSVCLAHERGAEMKKQKINWLALWLAIGVLAVFAVAYIGVATYFNRHFLFQTEVNGQDMSLKTPEELETWLDTQVADYTLTFVERDGTEETIPGTEFALQRKNNEEIKKILKKQNAFLWPKSIFKKTVETVSLEVEYNEEALMEKVHQLRCFAKEQTAPENARPEYNGTEYVIRAEVPGSGANQEKLEQKVKEYVSGLIPKLDIEAEECYLMPQYTSESEEVKQACETLNKYIQTSITYTMDVPVVVDRNLISTWLSVNENMEVSFNEQGVRDWLTQFGDTYDTLGTTRSLTTPTGKETTVYGGTYGWSVDEDTEFVYLIDAIKNGKVETKEPAYYAGGTAASHGPQDWGTTFLEVDLSAQYMWYIVDGTVVLETPVVTGEPIPEKITPQGVYSILEMLQDTYLKGNLRPDGTREYVTHVDYWMRVTWSGIGFHDAIWQRSFGGSRNQIPGVGSHGCINMPLDKAEELYFMLALGTPVVIHY